MNRYIYILNIFQLSNRRFCSACGAPEKTSDSSRSFAVDVGVGPQCPMTETMTAKVQKPGTGGTGGGVVKGYDLLWYKRDLRRVCQISTNWHSNISKKPMKSKNLNLFS